MQSYTDKWPELKAFLKDVDERFSNSHRPKEEVIMDDVDLRNFLKISKRKTAQLRAERKIKYYKAEGKIFYTLADVIKYVKRFPFQTIEESTKFKV